MGGSARGYLFRTVLGVVILLAGLAVIGYVLVLGLHMFQDPKLGLGAASTFGKTPSATDIGVGFGVLIVRIALLFLGSIGGSLIANKGIHLLFAAPTVPAATHGPQPHPAPHPQEARPSEVPLRVEPEEPRAPGARRGGV